MFPLGSSIQVSTLWALKALSWGLWSCINGIDGPTAAITCGCSLPDVPISLTVVCRSLIPLFKATVELGLADIAISCDRVSTEMKVDRFTLYDDKEASASQKSEGGEP